MQKELAENVQIHKTHRVWFIVFVIIVLAGYAVYHYEARRGTAARVGPSGGSAVGLVFGIAAAVLLLFAATRGLRRWMPGNLAASEVWRVAHLWLGALVLPLAWYHGAFRHGGSLTSASMWLLYIVTLSGFLAAMMRYFITAESKEPAEEAIKRLAAQAQDVVVPCGPLNGGDIEQWRAEQTRFIQSRVELAGGAHPRETLLAEVAAAPMARSEPLKELYLISIRQYLDGGDAQSVLADPIKAGQVLRRYRNLLPEELHGRVERLQRICDDCRTLRSRDRIQRRMEGWMLVHAPLSLALIILVALHAIYSLRY